MNICMSGLDHEHADIALREQLSFVPGQVSQLLQTLQNHPAVLGCVLLSTCNRTEVYCSVKADACIHPAQLLCTAAGVAYAPFRDVFVSCAGQDAVRHLTEVACGLRSQILGEDQIVSQVRQAIRLAREAHTADAVLETLFRCAVTAGKAVKTQTRLTAVPRSAAEQGILLAEQKLGSLHGKRAVVIGNGEMGRLTCDLLVAHGAEVTVTLRTYRHGETIVPRGCKTQAYEQRMEAIEGCDLVVSATTSPHYTIMAEQIAQLQKKPKLLVDLALPRDIDPAVASLAEVYNMDHLGALASENAVDCARAQTLVEEQMARFYEWASYRAALPLMEQLKQAAFDRVFTGETDEDAVRTAVEKTVDLLLGGMKEVVSPALMQKALDKMQKTAEKAVDLRNSI